MHDIANQRRARPGVEEQRVAEFLVAGREKRGSRLLALQVVDDRGRIREPESGVVDRRNETGRADVACQFAGGLPGTTGMTIWSSRGMALSRAATITLRVCTRDWHAVEFHAVFSLSDCHRSQLRTTVSRGASRRVHMEPAMNCTRKRGAPETGSRRRRRRHPAARTAFSRNTSREGPEISKRLASIHRPSAPNARWLW